MMDRVKIGCNYAKKPFWKFLIAVPLVYLPIITSMPFVIIGVFLVRTHLKFIGGMDIKSYWNDFVPGWSTYRYNYKNQITCSGLPWYNIARYKFFWIFNCRMYCPLSVALFKYATYLIEIVENFWCPFKHGKKHEYKEGAIDKSFWHIDPQCSKKLNPDDLNNPMWNEDSKK